ncbi:MAG: helix-turn-helix transcriptional regulator [Prevotella sp.]|jgi:AraC-like DNA-binding protein|nr:MULTISPECIES: helix-turn-helix transcriptional regulator [unclassified Prevotella]MCH3992152.1 helix-turn-helix transcriptional regulator [Prevotella sp.]MCH4099809.1 helix-turn-helix transcriptional regulator [Prevotella sp.]MCH4186899.1 helix-turn-helix transcriptional regulator [Prevotella sp.]MCI1370922.1 helix-turn-helix transcriptional regulator [Prevotella sp.]MCI1415824.1 helix-turn-helix transcriptional regulator [Prevotella sp.]
MEKEQLKRITFSRFRKMIEEKAGHSDSEPFAGSGFFVTLNAVHGIKRIFKCGIPLRFEDMRMGYIKSGEADLILNLIPCHVKKGMLIYISSESIMQVDHYSDDFNLEGFTLPNDMLNVSLHGDVPSLMTFDMYDVRLMPSEEEITIFKNLLAMLWSVATLLNSDQELAGDLVSALVHYYNYLFVKYNKSEDRRRSRERDIFNKFIYLVNRSHGIERQLDYYADKMFLSQRYLGSIIKKVSGVTAKEWIDRAAITEIKVLLKHSDKQITQIADQLHFSNDSFFSRFFKRLTGTTPKKYRENS